MIHPFQVTKGVMMRGTDEASGSLFSYVDLDERVPAGHPLRKIRQIVNGPLASLDTEIDALYRKEGCPSIAPERLILASLLQILFSIRSKRQLMEQMDDNLLFRWFVGLGIDEAVWGEGARKFVLWTDFSPERAEPRVEDPRCSPRTAT